MIVRLSWGQVATHWWEGGAPEGKHWNINWEIWTNIGKSTKWLEIWDSTICTELASYMLQTWLIDQDRKRSCQASVTQVTDDSAKSLWHQIFLTPSFDSATSCFKPSSNFLTKHGWQMTRPFLWHWFKSWENLIDWMNRQADTGLR